MFPFLFVLMAGILWGTAGTTQTFLDSTISPFSIATVRSAIGGGVLLVIATFLGKIDLKKWSWKWTILAAVCIALFQGLFFSAVRLTGVAIGTVVTIGSSPVFSGAIEWAIWRTRPTHVWAIATLLAIVGCALLFLFSGDASVHIGGILLALCAGFMFALYTNMSKQLMEQEETLPAVAMTFTICAILLLPLSVGEGFGWVMIRHNLYAIGFMAIMATSVAYLLFLSGLSKISSSAAVTLSLAEPLTAAILGVFLLGEYLSPTSWIGVVLLLGGIVVLTLGSRRAEIR